MNDPEKISEEENDYLKYRGKCKEMCEQLVAENPSLVMVRGHYYCPIWNSREPHWWCKDGDTIIDPTKNQFPSKGMGEYEEFNGICECEQCGKEFKEEDGIGYGRYMFCSSNCICLCVLYESS